MIALYEPRREELWFRQRLLADADTMSYNRAWGGVIDFPEERWADWYDRWIARTEGKRFYRYLRREDGVFVGEAAYHYDGELGGYAADVIVLASERGRGYGSEGLALLCAAARENGVRVLWDDIAADNPARALFLRQGFAEACRTEDKICLRKEL